MTEEQKQRQLVLAKANLRNAERNLRAKKGTDEQVEAAEKVLAELRGFDVAVYKKVTDREEKTALRAIEAGQKQVKTSFEQVSDYPLEVRELIDKLVRERDDVHYQKSLVCNSLAKIPKEVSAKIEVRQVLELRNKWKGLNAKIRFVQQHGQLPPEADEAVDLSKNLTIDHSGFEKAQEVKELYVLQQDLYNLRTNLSKARKNLNKVADLGKQAHYKQKVAELEWQVRVMGAVYDARKA